jgi:hypothetical protein
LQKKLEAAKSPEPNLCKSRLKTGLPLKFVQEVIGIQHPKDNGYNTPQKLDSCLTPIFTDSLIVIITTSFSKHCY